MYADIEKVGSHGAGWIMTWISAMLPIDSLAALTEYRAHPSLKCEPCNLWAGSHEKERLCRNEVGLIIVDWLQRLFIVNASACVQPAEACHIDQSF